MVDGTVCRKKINVLSTCYRSEFHATVKAAYQKNHAFGVPDPSAGRAREDYWQRMIIVGSMGFVAFYGFFGGCSMIFRWIRSSRWVE